MPHWTYVPRRFAKPEIWAGCRPAVFTDQWWFRVVRGVDLMR